MRPPIAPEPDSLGRSPITKIPLETVTFQRPRCIEQRPTRPGNPEAIDLPHQHWPSFGHGNRKRRGRDLETLAPPWSRIRFHALFRFDRPGNNLFCTRGAHGNDCLGVLRPLSQTSSYVGGSQASGKAALPAWPAWGRRGPVWLPPFTEARRGGEPPGSSRKDRPARSPTYATSVASA